MKKKNTKRPKPKTPEKRFSLTATGQYGDGARSVKVDVTTVSSRPEKQLAEIETLKRAIDVEVDRLRAVLAGTGQPAAPGA